MVDETDYDESVIELQPGDRLYLHLDGLTEEVNVQDEQFGDERLLNAIADGYALSLSDSVDSPVRQGNRGSPPAGPLHNPVYIAGIQSEN